MKFFFIPFLYFYHSRLKSITKALSWVFIYIFPIFIFCFISDNNSLQDAAWLFLYITGIYTIYEIGYINNDCETIKNENNPTLRLLKSELEYYDDNRKLIYISRGIISFIIGVVLSFSEIASPYYVVASYTGLLVTFLVYNSVRSILNLPLHFLLVLFRFSSFTLVFNLGFDSFIATIFIFPLVNLFERCGEARFKLPFFQKSFFSNHDLFRVVYYTIALTFLLSIDAYDPILYTVTYMLVYRTLSPLVFNFITKR